MHPTLVAALAERFRLIGNCADAIRRVKDPAKFFGTLAQLGIRASRRRSSLPPPTAKAG